MHTSHAPVSGDLRQQTYVIAIYTAKLSITDVAQDWFEASTNNAHQTEQRFLEGNGKKSEQLAALIRAKAAGAGDAEAGQGVGQTVPQGTSPHTDATAFIKLHGRDKMSDEMGLVIEAKDNAFLPGCTDEFTFTCAPLGDLKAITIGHDNKGMDSHTSRWKVDKVVVTCLRSEKAPGVGDYAKLSGEAANKQWQFVLHESDEDGGKWIGGAGGGDLAANDAEIEKIKAQISQLQKKLGLKQVERTVAANGQGAAVQQSREVPVSQKDPNKKHHKKQRQCCVFCFCILLGVVGAFVGDLIAEESGGASFTAGVALDVLDDTAREQMALSNRTDSMDAHEVNGRTEVQIGWVVGMVIGVVAFIILTVVFSVRDFVLNPISFVLNLMNFALKA